MLEDYPELLTPTDIADIFQIKAKNDDTRLRLNKALNLIKTLGIGVKVGKRVYVRKQGLINWIIEHEGKDIQGTDDA